MSMLTPPGMGGKYRITGDKYPRMRRRGRRGRLGLALVASVAALGLAGWGVLQLIDVFTGGDKASAAGATADCGSGASASPSPSSSAAKSDSAALPKPAQITVNVLNATPTAGLAKETADELKKRGFKIGDVGNAPAAYDKKVKGTAVLLGPPAALNTSLTVLGTQVTGAEGRADGRKGTDVDLIIGSGFKTLTTKAAADKALTALTHPQPTATPSHKAC
ncbi:LytR C-terminal domain-containing protein [Streptomyces sp. NPDC090106]|uniref:LytR C-terminal domain-containing protein n=1 Tax=Streptomyces sp. NPDC090106 TaxID=3365946 RepID=UPI0037FA6963